MLIVDDSSVMRNILTEILLVDPGIEVVGTAPDAEIARRKIKELNPDVITLDVELPGMNGLAFLEKIMRLRPMPVVMISGYTQEGSEAGITALEIGAVDIVAKSSVNLDTVLSRKTGEIVEKVKAAAKANFSSYSSVRTNVSSFQKKPVSTSQSRSAQRSNGKVICIGASAGGVEAIRSLVPEFSAELPPILYVQHMPKEFTSRFAARLNAISPLNVCEARNGQAVLPGHMYVAPGDTHLILAKSRDGYICRLDNGVPVCGHRPSVDRLFQSAAAVARADTIGVLLTGMGRDGAEGLLALREAGAVTLGQDEASSLIYGMPRVAHEIGAVSKQLPLRRMVEEITTACAIRNASTRAIK